MSSETVLNALAAVFGGVMVAIVLLIGGYVVIMHLQESGRLGHMRLRLPWRGEVADTDEALLERHERMRPLIADTTMELSLIGSPRSRRALADLRYGVRYDGTTPILPAPNDDRCPDCGGRRCWAWRDSGHARGCDNQPQPGNSWVGTEEAVRSPGAHTVISTVRRWVDADWNPLPLETRVAIAPTAWDRRLPVLAGR